MSGKKELTQFGQTMAMVKEASELAKTKELQQSMKSQAQNLLKVSDDTLAKLDANLAPYSSEEIKKMLEEEITELYTIDGKELTIDLDLSKDKLNEFRRDLDLSKDKLNEFRRDFLVYMKQISENEANLDDELNKLNTVMKEHDEEYSKLLESMKTMYILSQQQMEEYIASEEITESQREAAKDVLKWMKHAITLQPVLEAIETYNLENALHDFKYRQEAIGKKYKTVTKRIGVKTSLHLLADLEKVLGLPEEYLEYTNLCIFLTIRFVAYNQSLTKTQAAAFVSHLALVYRALIEETIRPEDKEALTQACKTIIDKARAVSK